MTQPTKPVTLSDEEHNARAMLMGMVYHHGNGEPFYYKNDEDGNGPEIGSMIDANTLKPLVDHDKDSRMMDWVGLSRRTKSYKTLTGNTNSIWPKE